MDYLTAPLDETSRAALAATGLRYAVLDNDDDPDGTKSALTVTLGAGGDGAPGHAQTSAAATDALVGKVVGAEHEGPSPGLSAAGVPAQVRERR